MEILTCLDMEKNILDHNGWMIGNETSTPSEMNVYKLSGEKNMAYPYLLFIACSTLVGFARKGRDENHPLIYTSCNVTFVKLQELQF